MVNYNSFISNFEIYIKSHSSNLGIDNHPNFLDNVVKRKVKNISSEGYNKYSKIIKAITNKIDNEDILNKILTRLFFIISYGNIVDVTKNYFIGEVEHNGDIYSVHVVSSDNMISCYSKFNDEFSNIFYKKGSDQNIVYYDEKIIKKYEHSEDEITYFDIINKKTTKFYDKNGRQSFESIEKVKEDYFKNNVGEVFLTEPDVWDNYTSKEYFWRLKNYIIWKKEVKHVFNDTDDVFIKGDDGIKYYIGDDSYPDSSDIVCPVLSNGIKESTAESYINKLISSQNLYKKVRNRTKNSYYNYLFF